MTLWDKINTPGSLASFKGKACIYPKPFKDKTEVVRWFYSRNNGCQVFFACSREVSELIDKESWADVSYEFILFVEQELMPYCVENTDWQRCAAYGIEYYKKLSKKQSSSCGRDFGCSGTTCHCEPFGEGDFTYGIADESEFIIQH